MRLGTLIAITALVPAFAVWSAETPVVEFGGQTWEVKNAPSWGPGPNRWSAENVRIDDDGLHLSVTTRDGQWSCAELICTRGLGYGEYRWTVQGDFAQFSPRHVFACFIYEADDREMEAIEISRWGDENNKTIFQHVVQPGTADSRYRFLPDVTRFTVTLTWLPGSAECRMWDDETGRPLSFWRYTGPKVPAASDLATARMNLWLYRGEAQAGDERQVTVRDFRFTPADDKARAEKRVTVQLSPDGAIAGRLVGFPEQDLDKYTVRVEPYADQTEHQPYREATQAGKPADIVFRTWLRVRVSVIEKATGRTVAQTVFPE